MEKILFLALNSSWSQSNLALYYLREMIRDLDYIPLLATFTTKEPLHQILEETYALQADIICLSAYIWNRVFLQSIQKELAKIMPHARFVVGGPEAAHFADAPNTMLVTGPGESPFRKLALGGFCAKLSQDSDTENIHLKDIPFPYQTEDVADMAGHLIYYECYRGCPYSCIFCLSARDCRREARFDLNREGERARLHSELHALAALKPRTLKFIDRSFNVKRELAREIWSFAIDNEFDFDFHFEIYPDLVQEQDIDLLSRAPQGRIRFELGIQSTNDEILARSGRVSDWQKSREVLKTLKLRTQIRVHADLLIGLPQESFSSIIKSLNELCACEPAAVQLGTLKILPDTPMQDIARQRGYLWMDDPPYQILQSDTLSFSDICLLQDYAHLLNLYWNKEEHTQVWHTLLQKYQADRVLDTLRSLHHEQQMPLHSVSRPKRETIMQKLVTRLFPFDAC